MSCLECGGFAKAKEELCSLCNGEGKPKKALKAEPKKKKFFK